MRNAVNDAWGFEADAHEDRVAHRCYFGGGSSTNTVQKADPWSGQQPYLQQQFQQAASLYGNYTPSYYPNQQVAPFNDVQRAALGNIAGVGLGGTSALNAAQGAITNIAGGQLPGQQAAANNFGGANSAIANNLNGAGIGGMMPAYTQMQGGLANLAGGGGNAAVAPSQNALGQFLGGPNSALEGSVAAQVLPQIESQFGSAGGMSNPNAAYAASSGLTSAMAPYTLQAAQQQAQTAMGEQGIQLGASGLTNQAMLQQQALQQQAAQQASQNYFQGQGQQLVGSQIAPSLNASTLQNLQAALGAGGQSQQQRQADINAAMNAWNYNTMLPYNKLGMFGNAISGNFGSTTNLQQPYFTNPIGQALSGLTGAASIGSSLNSMGLFGGAAGAGAGVLTAADLAALSVPAASALGGAGAAGAAVALI